MQRRRHTSPFTIASLIPVLVALTATAASAADDPQISTCNACGNGDVNCGCDDALASSSPLLISGYGGSIWERPNLTGDWGGLRSSLAGEGIIFQGDVTQYYQGVTSGGRNTAFRYGGHSDYLLNMDLGKLGVQEGLFLKLRGESQFGEFSNRDSGALLPVNNSGLLPTPGGQETALTNVLFTQFLSESFAVFFGKLDTLDGDANAFAGGRGKNQFMNSAFVFNPVSVRTVPYSTIGAGFTILQQQQPIFTFSVIDSQDSATTNALDDLFESGATLSAELRLPVEFFGLPGHQLFGGTWSGRDVALLDQDFRLLLPLFGLPLQQKSDSWSLYYNFDQFLVVDPSDPTRGWGVFGRAGLGDEDTNPLEWFFSLGVGGNSPLPCREEDTFGVGYYYAAASDALPGILLGDHGQGVELFYNIPVTPWLHVTPDLQIIDPARKGLDTAVLVGMRVKADF